MTHETTRAARPVTAKRIGRLAAAALAAFTLQWGAQRAPAQTSAWMIDTFAGGGGTGVLTTLSSPRGVAVDSNGNIYIGDVSNHRVIRIDGATKNSSVFAGTTGTSGNAGDGGAATSATLNEPYGVAVDSAGNVLIADTGNRRIRKVTLSTGNIAAFAGTGSDGGDVRLYLRRGGGRVGQRLYRRSRQRRRAHGDRFHGQCLDRYRAVGRRG